MAPPAAHEALFSALGVEVVLPTTAGLTAPPREAGQRAEWWAGIQALPPREAAFLDEKLAYVVALRLPHTALSSDDAAPGELRALLKHVQVTATASFLPTVMPSPRDTPAPAAGSGIAAPAPQAASLAPPVVGGAGKKAPSPVPDGAQHASSRAPEQHESGEGGAPLTPRPLPATAPGAEAYADLEGVTVWEGAVDVDGDRPSIVRTEDAWVAVFRGELPVVYVRTQIANPVFALTASATLRDSRTRRTAAAATGSDTASIRSTLTEGTVQLDDADEEEPLDIAHMEEIDLLGGLANDRMPASRLGPSLLDDLAMTTPITPIPSSSPWTPAPLDAGVTLRKSYRTVLALLPGLRVRMRTLFLPQLLPPGASTGSADDADDTMDRKIVLCVEVENGADSGEYAFEIETVSVDIAGKGPKATAELVCQPGMDGHASSSSPSSPPDGPVFPLHLSVLEQYNLLYGVTIESSPGTGGPDTSRSKSDENRPVSIVLTGRPFRGTRTGVSPSELIFPTGSFQSRWNCNLDLAPFYASMPPPPPPPPVQAAAPRQAQHRISKPMPPPPSSAIAGDKRYSLANLLGADAPDRRMVSNPPRPVSLPSAVQSRVMSTRGGPAPAPIGDGHGLFVSVRLLPPGAGLSTPPSEPAANASNAIYPLDTFSIEVFVHNRTDAVRRFRLGVPARDSSDARIRDLWNRRRRRAPDEPSYGVDDQVLGALLSQHEAAAPPLVSLETDVRCGPLLPGASLAARIRFLALRDGVHRIDRLRLTGIGDEFDFVISPVLEVVVDQRAT